MFETYKVNNNDRIQIIYSRNKLYFKTNVILIFFKSKIRLEQ